MDKKKIRNILMGYLAVIAIIIFFSETIRSLSYPNVETSTAMSGKLIKQEEATGKLDGMNKITYYEESTTKIDQVFVKQGDVVEIGQLIASYDVSGLQEEIQKKIQEKEIEYVKLQNVLQIACLENKKQSDVEKEDKDYTYELEQKRQEIVKAKEKVELNEALTEQGFIPKTEYQDSVKQLANHEYAYQKLEEEEADYKNQLAAEQHNAEIDEAINKLKIQSMELDLQMLKKEIEELNKQPQKRGIFAQEVGIIESLYIEEKQSLTKDTKLYTLIKDKNLYQMKLKVSSDLIKVLQVGEDISVKTDNLVGIGEIKEVGGYGGESYILIGEIIFDREDISKTLIGEAASVKIITNLGDFNSIVSSRAIRQEGSKSIVYMVEEESGAFGNTYVAKRIEVKPGKSNGDYTAVEGLPRNEQIIIDADRPLEDGISVNVR